MASQGDSRTRKFPGGRPLPRRLFSSDSTKSNANRESTVSTSTTTSDNHGKGHGRDASIASTIREEGDPFGNRSPTPSSSYTPHTPRSGTPSEFDFLPKSAIRVADAPPSKSSKFRLHRPPPISSSQSASTLDAGVPTTPSKLRWDQLRSHVIPPSESHASLSSSFVPPSREGASTPTSGRSTPTPKPSRLAARFGFKQVVESARANTTPSESIPPPAAVPPEPSAFEKELRLATWAARYAADAPAAPGRSGHLPRQPTQATMASTIWSLAASNPAASASMVTLSTTAQSKLGVNRGQATAHTNSHPPSVAQLHSTLISHASSTDSGQTHQTHLPMEPELLAALLLPFFPQTGAALSSAEDERALAMEAFEVLSKTWLPASAEDELDRVLWICHAAALSLPTSSVRTHLVGTLYSALFPRGRAFRGASTPSHLRSLVLALLRLQATFVDPESGRIDTDSSEAQLLRDLFSQVTSSGFADLDQHAVEVEYGASYSDEDEQESIRHEILCGAFLQSLSWFTARRKRLWAIEMVKNSWHSLGPEPPRLLQLITSRNHSIFLMQATTIVTTINAEVGSEHTSLDLHDDILACRGIIHLARDRILADLPHLTVNAELITSIRSLLVCVLLGIAATARGNTPDHTSPSAPASDHALELLESLLRSPMTKDWKSAFSAAVELLLPPRGTWKHAMESLEATIDQLAADDSKTFATIAMPLINQRLATAQPTDQPHIVKLLDKVSSQFPQIFYKPLFACATATKENAIVQHFRTLLTLSKYVPDFWTRDADMIAIAIAGDVGSTKPVEGEAAGPPRPRLGQLALFAQVVIQLRTERLGKFKVLDSSAEQTRSLRSVSQFAVNLEARLGAMLSTKDNSKPLFMSQQALYCALFLETRLLTRSLRSSSWLSQVVSWTVGFLTQADDDDLGYYGNLSLGQDDELGETTAKLQTLLAQLHDAPQPTTDQRKSMALDLSMMSTDKSAAPIWDSETTAFFERAAKSVTSLVSEVAQGCMPLALRLLVALSAIMTTDEYRRLGAALWEQSLNNEERSVSSETCFLILQAAEKNTTGIMEMMMVAIQSSDATTRRNSVHKLAILYASRAELGSLDYIVDRNHPRPFKQARPQSSFLPTDVGSARWVHTEHPDEAQDRMPVDLRKQLSDIGWEHDDALLDLKRERTRTPMTLLPLRHMEQLQDQDVTVAAEVSPLPSPQHSPARGAPLSSRVRRLSIVHGPKRRIVHVAALASLILPLSRLSFDADHGVAQATNHLLFYLMKEDPNLLSRPIFDLLETGRLEDVQEAIQTLGAYQHIATTMPPVFAHSIFNHLAGYLKYVRQHQPPRSLSLYADTLPSAVRVAPYVSEMSMNALRKDKLDVFVTPSMDLWFPPTAPDGAMFPRYLSDRANPLGPLKDIVMIRTVQNVLMLRLLQQNPAEIHILRRSPSRLVLPTRDGGTACTAPPLDLTDSIPILSKQTSSDPTIDRLSEMLSRSFVLLATQVFRCLPSHLNDRRELVGWLDGLNRIITTHGQDALLVSHAMIAFVIAATRFKRIFTSAGGFTLIMPSIFKVYAECLSDADAQVSSDAYDEVNVVKQAIEWTVGRLYGLHSETFLFQSLDVLSRMAQLPHYPKGWATDRIFRLFLSLEKGPSHDATGIASAIREWEQQKNAQSADGAAPVLAMLRHANASVASTQSGRRPSDFAAMLLEDEGSWTWNRLKLDDLVRLFLTVIAHDPSRVRAQYFLHLLVLFTKSLCATKTRILAESIDALSVVLLKAANKAKVPEGAQLKSPIDAGEEVYSHYANSDGTFPGNMSSASDLTAMRADFLNMVSTFMNAGKSLLPLTTVVRVLEVVRVMAATPGKEIQLSTFLGKAIRTAFSDKYMADLRSTELVLDRVLTLVEETEDKLDLDYFFSAIVTAVSTASRYTAACRRLSAIGMRRCKTIAFGAERGIHVRQVTVSLCSAAMLHSDVVMEEIERNQPPSLEILSYIILPLVLDLPTGIEVDTPVQDSRRAPLTRIWGRLLGYALRGAQWSEEDANVHRTSSLGGIRRSQSRSRQDQQSSAQVPGERMAMVVQIVKIIVLRVQSSLPSVLPDVWLRLTTFLSCLLHGDAKFAVQQQKAALSDPFLPPSSPTFTPLSLSAAPGSPRTPHRQNSTESQDSMSVPASTPRLVDFLMWSLFEILVQRPHPLMLTLRPIMQSKAAALSQALTQAMTQPVSPVGTPDRRASRRMSEAPSLFVKPRRRSGMPSPLLGSSTPRSSFLSPHVSPPGSPLLSPSTPTRSQLRVPSLYDSLNPERPAGYSRLSVTSPIAGPGGLPIRHLGPAGLHSPIPPSPSTHGADDRIMMLETPLKSDALVQRTYQAIRAVQRALGYPRLVELPARMWQQEVETKRWTDAALMAAAAQDAHLVLAECHWGNVTEPESAHGSISPVIGRSRSMEEGRPPT